MAERYRNIPIDHIAVIESRGFLLGAPLAYLMNTGLILIRKCGGEVVECAFLVNLPELGGNERLREIGCPTFSLCAFDGE